MKRRGWDYLPVDDVGYVSPCDVALLPDESLREWVRRFEQVRYSGWRNHDGLWRRELGLDTTTGKHVLDYGCGFGIEALQFARAGNAVSLADLYYETRQIAVRILRVMGYGHAVRLGMRSMEEPPYLELNDSTRFDVFYANGVLHHSTTPRDLLSRAHGLLAPGGELRLMLYSDKAWTQYVGTPLPREFEDVREADGYEKFVEVMDAVGSHADWYNEEKLRMLADGLFTVRRFAYITNDGRYCAAVLDPVR